MKTNLLWTGREYYSLENCQVNKTETAISIDSTIVGKYGDMLYRIEYIINTGRDWRTRYVDIKAQLNGQLEKYYFESDGAGNWQMNGKPAAQFFGCIDVDIPLTPSTNSLPINRMDLKRHEAHEIRVLYLDVLNHSIRPVQQLYRRIDDVTYHYENIPNDFEADIIVDTDGFVVDYPGLFVRTHATQANPVRI